MARPSRRRGRAADGLQSFFCCCCSMLILVLIKARLIALFRLLFINALPGVVTKKKSESESERRS